MKSFKLKRVNNLIKVIVLSCFFILFCCTERIENKSFPVKAISNSKPESFLNYYHLDSTYKNVWIDGSYFTILVLSDPIAERLNTYPCLWQKKEIDVEKSVLILDKKRKVVFQEKVNKFLDVYFSKIRGKLNEKGRLYMTLNFFPGLSGYQTETSVICMEDGNIRRKVIFESSEMSAVYFDKFDAQFIILRAMDGGIEQNEVHYSEHRRNITLYKFKGNSLVAKELGNTRYKYESMAEEEYWNNFLKTVTSKESIMSSVNYKDFCFDYNNVNGQFLHLNN